MRIQDQKAKEKSADREEAVIRIQRSNQAGPLKQESRQDLRITALKKEQEKTGENELC